MIWSITHNFPRWRACCMVWIDNIEVTRYFIRKKRTERNCGTKRSSYIEQKIPFSSDIASKKRFRCSIGFTGYCVIWLMIMACSRTSHWMWMWGLFLVFYLVHDQHSKDRGGDWQGERILSLFVCCRNATRAAITTDSGYVCKEWLECCGYDRWYKRILPIMRRNEWEVCDKGRWLRGVGRFTLLCLWQTIHRTELR